MYKTTCHRIEKYLICLDNPDISFKISKILNDRGGSSLV